MGLHENWKVITDHHSTPRNLLHSPKRKDFTTTVSPLGGARANDEAESFMKLLNKTEKIAHFQQNCDPRNADRLPINTTPCYRNNAVRSTNEQTSKNQVRPSAERKQPRVCTRYDDQQEGQRVQRENQAECPQ